ncbi:MAG TPA: TIGR03435 family protein, partial [Bryobacteraceae bacterium]
MLSRLACACLTVFFCGTAFGQTAKFVIADVHATPPDLANDFMQANPPSNGRYEFHSASMIDLIQLAYGFDPDRILGGPNWLEMDRFDVIAQAPPGTRETPPPGARPGTLPNAVQEMLQSLLADRFHLAIREETKSLPGFTLTVDQTRKLQVKESDGPGNTGCRSAEPPEPAQPTITVACRNMTMDSLAALLSRLMGAPLVQVVDKTGLKEKWDFELSVPRSVRQNEASAMVSKLGLKLEPQPMPTQVAMVESADEKPTAKPPGVSEALPIPPQPTAFDVATIKPTDPDYRNTTISLGAQAGGRWSTRGIPLSALLIRAFSPSFDKRNSDLVVGMPSWAERDSVRFGQRCHFGRVHDAADVDQIRLQDVGAFRRDYCREFRNSVHALASRDRDMGGGGDLRQPTVVIRTYRLFIEERTGEFQLLREAPRHRDVAASMEVESD